MAGIAAVRPVVGCGGLAAAVIARNDALDAFDMAEHAFDTPETAAGKDRGGRSALVGGIVCGGRDADRLFGGERRLRNTRAERR